MSMLELIMGYRAAQAASNRERQSHVRFLLW
jgi:hypothetical protein